jgi:hypothetical protein
MRGRRKGVRKSNVRIEQTKVKFEMFQETPLTTDFGINYERQGCKMSTVGGILCKGRRINEEDKGEGIWLMDFIYLYKIEQ